MTVGVYGLGRFGTYWASLLAEKYKVIGYSRSHKPDLPKEIEPVSKEQLAQADTIFMCVSISSFEAVLKDLAPLLKPGSTLFDTCSVKVHPAGVMQQVLPDHVQAIASHPMFGPDSGKNGTEGLPMVMSSLTAEPETFEYWKRIFLSYGMQVIEMSPDEHDHQAAYTQGVTHFIGRVLQDLHLPDSRIATMGYRKLLEIIEQTCNDPLQLFYDLQRYNPYTGEMRNAVFHSFQHTLDMLEPEDKP